jgi:3-phosphoshikimate 1-carboxyvinyltransferase
MGCQVVWGEDFIEVQGPARIGIECEMSDISDTVQTLAAVSLFVNGPTTIRGIAHNRLKETDRIGDLAIELRKLGASVTEHADGFTVIPENLCGAVLSTYNDHRMAMSLALVGLKVPGVEIENPECVVKTYPNFFHDLEQFVGG